MPSTPDADIRAPTRPGGSRRGRNRRFEPWKPITNALALQADQRAPGKQRHTARRIWQRWPPSTTHHLIWPPEARCAIVTFTAVLQLTAILVADYDDAIAFFTQALGFELAEDWPARTNDGRTKRWVVVRPPAHRPASSSPAPTANTRSLRSATSTPVGSASSSASTTSTPATSTCSPPGSSSSPNPEPSPTAESSSSATSPATAETSSAPPPLLDLSLGHIGRRHQCQITRQDPATCAASLTSPWLPNGATSAPCGSSAPTDARRYRRRAPGHPLPMLDEIDDLIAAVDRQGLDDLVDDAKQRMPADGAGFDRP